MPADDVANTAVVTYSNSEVEFYMQDTDKDTDNICLCWGGGLALCSCKYGRQNRVRGQSMVWFSDQKVRGLSPSMVKLPLLDP